MAAEPSDHNIGTLNEKPLHAALKEYYRRPGDRVEVPLDGYRIDIVRGDLLVEVQTGNFSAISGKLRELVRDRPVRLVYPVAREKWIVRLAEDGDGLLGRRKSPKRGCLEEAFRELVRIPELLADPNFALHVLLIQEEEVRRRDPKRAWRRRHWVTVERRLLDVVDGRLFGGPADVLDLLPADMPEPFSTAQMADALGRPRRLAQKAAYCMRKMGAIKAVGKQGNAVLYRRAA